MTDAFPIIDLSTDDDRDIIPAMGADIAAIAAEPWQMLLDPVLPAGSLMLIRGPRGAGLTQLLAGLAGAIVSGGGLLGWRAPQPSRVLMMTGGLSLQSLSRRLALALEVQGNDPTAAGRLMALAAEQQGAMVDDLSDEGIQRQLMPLLGQVEVMMIDEPGNLLSSAAAEPDETVRDLRAWLLFLRRIGKSVVLAQSSSPGDRRPGSRLVLSLAEDLADVVLDVQRPAYGLSHKTPSFELRIARAAHFEAPTDRSMIVGIARGADGRPAWTVMPGEGERRACFRDLLTAGMPEPLAREAMEISRTTSWRWRAENPGAAETP